MVVQFGNYKLELMQRKPLSCVFQGVLSTFFLLWVIENFPPVMIVLGIMAQLSHFVLLQNFPTVTFLSFGFIIAVILIVINHYFAFSYFTAVYHPFFEVKSVTSESHLFNSLILGYNIFHCMFVDSPLCIVCFSLSK